MAAGAVGLDPKRGDKIEIKNLNFSYGDFEDAEKLIADSERRSYFQKIVTYTVIGVVIALFFLVVVRPFVKWLTENTIDSV